jgi:hypothetical protein
MTVSREEPAARAGLPPGTRVWNRKTGNRARYGTVMPYQPQYWRHGSFPVRFDDEVWEWCDTGDVAVVPTQGDGDVPEGRVSRGRPVPPGEGR